MEVIVRHQVPHHVQIEVKKYLGMHRKTVKRGKRNNKDLIVNGITSVRGMTMTIIHLPVQANNI